MSPAEAVNILARLKAAYPMMTLDEDQAEILAREIALLTDESICDEAVTHLIHKDERFPTIARIRLAYRSVADARRTYEQATARAIPEPRVGIPEWVHVWRWQEKRTEMERRAAQTQQPPRIPVPERRPVRMRDFPQFPHPGPDAYTMAEYEQIHAEWVAAGSPSMGSTPVDLLDAVG